MNNTSYAWTYGKLTASISYIFPEVTECKVYFSYFEAFDPEFTETSYWDNQSKDLDNEMVDELLQELA